jgi:hypothetical protein
MRLQINEENIPADYAGHYSEQLIAYREMIEATGTVVDSVWIHFPLTGAMAKQL